MLAALVRPIFGAPDREAARAQLSEAVTTLEGRLPKVAAMLEAAEEDVLAFYAFPAAHRRNPLDQPARAPQPRDRAAHRRGSQRPSRSLEPSVASVAHSVSGLDGDPPRAGAADGA